MIKTSLIITVNNRSNSIRKSLLSLQNQSVKPDELILSDNGSDEDIISAIRIIAKKFTFPVKYIRQENKGFSLAKCSNNGIRNASGNFLIFLDQDTLHTKNLLRTFIMNQKENTLLTCMPIQLNEEQSLKITEGKIISDNYSHLIDKNLIDGVVKQYKKDKFFSYLNKLKLTSQPRMRNGFFAINKSDLVKVNGFDEKLIEHESDDDIARRLYQTGVEGLNPFRNEYAIKLFDPNTKMNTRHDQEYNVTRMQEIKKGKYRCEFGLDTPFDEDSFTVTILN